VQIDFPIHTPKSASRSVAWSRTGEPRAQNYAQAPRSVTEPRMIAEIRTSISYHYCVSEILFTPRLKLIAASTNQVRAIKDGDYSTASSLLTCRVPTGFPEDPAFREGLSWHLAALEDNPAHQLWRIRLVIEIVSNTVIGSINLKGPPSPEGDVEIGWGISPSARRRGFATEASSAVITWAFSSPLVLRVSATIPDENVASQHVARHVGMAKTHELRRGLPLWCRCKTRQITVSS